MISNSLQHVERSRGFLLCQEVDLQFEMIAPFGGPIDSILPNQDTGGQQHGFQREKSRE
jgi:hypothetical protein